MAADPAAHAATPRRRLISRLRPSGEHLLLAAAAFYVVVLCVLPLARLFMEALGGESGGIAFIWEIVTSRAARIATWHSIEASLGSVLVSIVIGTAFALIIGLTDVRLRAPLVFTLLLPMLIPAQITALAWLELTGPASTILGPLGLAPAPGTRNWLYSREGIIFLMGIEHSTMVFLAVRAGLRSLPRDLIEAAQAAGAKPARVIMAIILPLLRPALIAGAALAFVGAIGNFGIPAILGIPGRYPMLTALIYQRLSGFGPKVLGDVAALSMILALLAAAGLLVQFLASGRRHVTVTGFTALGPVYRLGRWRPLVEMVLWVTLLFIAVLPLLALVGTSLVQALGVALDLETMTWAHYATAFANDAVRRALVNSLWLAAAAAAASLLVSLPLGYLITCRRSRPARVLSAIADAPFALPGIVLSIAMILTFLKPLPIIGISLYGTAAIIFIAYLARFLASGLRPTIAGMAQLDPALEDAARIAGAGLIRRLTRIIFPMAAPAAIAGALLIFMSAYNELTVSALLWSTGTETIGVMIFNLYDEGNATAAAAASVLSLLVTLSAAGLASLLARRLPYGVLPWQA